MLERVLLTIEGGSEQTTLVCTWAGGRETTHRFVRPVRWTDQLSRGPALRARIVDLAQAGHRPPAIARSLTQEGWLSADGDGFTAGKVRAIMVRMGLPLRGVSLSAEVERQDDELTVPELAHRLDRPLGTLYAWIQIAATAAKAEQVAAQGIVPKHLLSLQRQARKALPHIRVSGRQPDTHARRDRD